MHTLQKLTGEKSIHRIFVASLILKGFNSFLEIMGGILFLFTNKLITTLSFWAQGELIEDPHDFIATHIQQSLPYFSSHSQFYVSFYLLSHGIIKLVLVVSLLRNKLWAYPATIVTILLFIAYQLYKLSHAYSLGLILLTLFDVLIIALTWHEYGIMKSHPRFIKKADKN